MKKKRNAIALSVAGTVLCAAVFITAPATARDRLVVKVPVKLEKILPDVTQFKVEVRVHHLEQNGFGQAVVNMPASGEFDGTVDVTCLMDSGRKARHDADWLKVELFLKNPGNAGWSEPVMSSNADRNVPRWKQGVPQGFKVMLDEVDIRPQLGRP